MEWGFLFFAIVGICCTVDVAARALRRLLMPAAEAWLARPYQPALDRIAACMGACS